MNKWSALSFVTAAVSAIAYFIMKGSDTNLLLAAAALGLLSLSRIVFSVISKGWLLGVIGFLLHGAVSAAAFLLLLAYGIAG